MADETHAEDLNRPGTDAPLTPPPGETPEGVDAGPAERTRPAAPSTVTFTR